MERRNAFDMIQGVSGRRCHHHRRSLSLSFSFPLSFWHKTGDERSRGSWKDRDWFWIGRVFTVKSQAVAAAFRERERWAGGRGEIFSSYLILPPVLNPRPIDMSDRLCDVNRKMNLQGLACSLSPIVTLLARASALSKFILQRKPAQPASILPMCRLALSPDIKANYVLVTSLFMLTERWFTIIRLFLNVKMNFKRGLIRNHYSVYTYL